MKSIKYSLLCLFISVSVAEELKVETSISGSVVRQGNNAPLSGANVMLSNADGLKLGTSTNEAGMFYFQNTPQENTLSP